MSNLCIRVKQLREGLGLSQYELSKNSAITQATISRIEAGKVQQLKSEGLKRLAAALKVSIDFLIGENENQNVEDVVARDDDARALVTAFSNMDAERRKQLSSFAAFLTKN